MTPITSGSPSRFSRVMSEAIDAQQNQQQSSNSLHMALQRMAWGTGARQQPGGRPPACDLCDGFKCPHESDANNPCDVFALSVSQHRAKDVFDYPPVKAFIDRARKRYGKALINYPQPTGVQKQKLESYDAYRESGDALRREREG